MNTLAKTLKPWWASSVEMVVITTCVVAVSLTLASDPSGDDVGKGVAGGLVAHFGGYVVRFMKERFS